MRVIVEESIYELAYFRFNLVYDQRFVREIVT